MDKGGEGELPKEGRKERLKTAEYPGSQSTRDMYGVQTREGNRSVRKGWSPLTLCLGCLIGCKGAAQDLHWNAIGGTETPSG